MWMIPCPEKSDWLWIDWTHSLFICISIDSKKYDYSIPYMYSCLCMETYSIYCPSITGQYQQRGNELSLFSWGSCNLTGPGLTCICPALWAPSWHVSSWCRPPWGHSSRWAHGPHPPRGVWGLQASGPAAYGWKRCRLDRSPPPDPSWPGGGRQLLTTLAGWGESKKGERERRQEGRKIKRDCCEI